MTVLEAERQRLMEAHWHAAVEAAHDVVVQLSVAYDQALALNDSRSKVLGETLAEARMTQRQLKAADQ